MGWKETGDSRDESLYSIECLLVPWALLRDPAILPGNQRCSPKTTSLRKYENECIQLSHSFRIQCVTQVHFHLPNWFKKFHSHSHRKLRWYLRTQITNLRVQQAATAERDKLPEFKNTFQLRLKIFSLNYHSFTVHTIKIVWMETIFWKNPNRSFEYSNFPCRDFTISHWNICGSERFINMN